MVMDGTATLLPPPLPDVVARGAEGCTIMGFTADQKSIHLHPNRASNTIGWTNIRRMRCWARDGQQASNKNRAVRVSMTKRYCARPAMCMADTSGYAQDDACASDAALQRCNFGWPSSDREAQVGEDGGKMHRVHELVAVLIKLAEGLQGTR
jgi:hypothetical protein